MVALIERGQKTPDVHIHVSTQMDLEVPEKIGLEAIYVRIEIEPPSCDAVIYGWSEDGNLQPVVIHASIEEAELPFVHPHIWIAYSEGMTKFRIKTLRWKEAKGPRFTPPQLEGPPSTPLN